MCRLFAPTDRTRSRIRIEALPGYITSAAAVMHASVLESFHPPSWADSRGAKIVTTILAVYALFFGGRVICLEAQVISPHAFSTKCGPPIGASYHKPQARLCRALKSVVRAPILRSFRMLRSGETHSSSTWPLASHSDLPRIRCDNTVLASRNTFSRCRVRASERLALRFLPSFVTHRFQDHDRAARVRSIPPD